jgi:hypothetical protein
MRKIFIKILLSSLLFVYISLINIGCHHMFEPYDHDRHDNDDEYYNNVSNTHFSATETFFYKLTVINHSKLRLKGINGNVTIIGGSGTDSVIISGEKRVASESTRDAEIHLQELVVNMQDLTNEIYVKTIQPQETYGRDYEVNYTIYVPNYFEISTDIVNGRVQIENINNLVTVNNVNGTTTLNNIYGSTYVGMVNGQIKSNQTLPLNGTINLITVNGNIMLDIPRNTSADLSADLTNGNVTSSNLDIRNPVIFPKSIHGTLGSGQGKIKLSAVNGNISISGF